MLKLDRTVFSTSKISDFKKESDNYSNLTNIQKAEAFAYLQSTAYNYPINNPPKMDRTFFIVRKLNG